MSLDSKTSKPKEFEPYDGISGPDWIDADEALDIVESQLGGSSVARDTLAHKLRDGKLRAVASATWLSNERNLTKALRESEAVGIVHNVILQPYAFRKSRAFRDDFEDWRWPLNKFFVTHRRKELTRRAFVGVRLSREDLSKFVDLSKPKKLRKPEQWVNMWHALIEIAQDGRLTEDHWPTRKTLREELLEQIGEGLSDKAIRSQVSQVWKKFCEGNHS